MVPTPAVAAHKTSLESQSIHSHPIFSHPEMVEEDVRTFVGKPEFHTEQVDILFGKQNPQVPNVMNPK